MICAEVYHLGGSSNKILDKLGLILYAPYEVNTSHWRLNMTNLSRWDPFRGISSFQEQMSRMFEDTVRGRTDQSALTTWAPAVDIYETEHELVVKADLPDVNEKDLDIRVENNVLTIRGERKFENSVSEDNYLRIERASGTFSRSFSLPNTVDPDAIKAEYRDGVLTVHVPKREEAKPKQIKVSVAANGK